MLYVFKVVGTPYVKMGYSNGCPYRRIATGLWSNVHPTECCGKLGWSDLQLLALFNGTMGQEAAVKMVLPPIMGEFWADEMLTPLLLVLGFIADACPLPARPSLPPDVGRNVEKLPCCSGEVLRCFLCNKTFSRWHHLQQHKQSHAGIKEACNRCGKRVLKRNMKRHEQSCSTEI
jgi:hypothetical protein